MSDEEMPDKVAMLREELRNGRRASNKADKDTVRHGESTDGQIGPGFQVVGRNNKATSGNRGAPTDNKRGVKEKSERIGQGSRRPGNDGGSSANGSEQVADITRRIGSLEGIDPLTERIDDVLPVKEEPAIKRPVGRPRKEDDSAAKVKKSFFKEGKVLSAQEALDYQDPLAAALIDYGGYADKYLRMQAHDPEMPDLWGDLTELEAQVLARIMIRRGQHNAMAAAVVRNTVNGSDYISAAVIVIPRAIRTAETLRKVPRKPKKGKAE